MAVIPAFSWKSWAVLLVAVVVVYGRMLGNLAVEWWKNDDYSHGLLLPFALGYLVYQKREYWATLPIAGSWLGLVVVLFSQVVSLTGFLGAEFFLQRTSFVILIGGAVLFLFGWKHLWESAFALLLLLLAIPLPVLIFNAVALPLQLIASSCSEAALQLFNIPVFREGNILQLPNVILSVAEACSGIRSLMSLITLGVMMAYFLPVNWWLRCLFVISTIPIAILANAFRVTGTGVLGRFYGEAAAQGFFHTFSGWLVFVLAFAVLLGEVALLMKIKRMTMRKEES
jgi:exosortase